jgi:SAM-dependent methyltransferase
MHGSRKLALDFIAPYLKPGLRVLDVCCGGAWLMEHVHAAGATYFGIDLKATNNELTARVDVTRTPWPCGQFDLAVSCYGTQHLLGDEALAWREARNHSDKFIVIGRYFDAAPAREMNREDPLTGYNHSGVDALALATGWRKPRDFSIFCYHNETFQTREDGEAVDGNAFACCMEAE